VILESDGFADLLERAEFMQRVSQQDARIIDRVREAKAEAVAAEKRLDALEEKLRKIAAEVARRAAEVDAIKDRLVDRQQEFQGARAVKARALATTRDHRRNLEGDLAALEKEQAAVLARLQSAQGGGSAGPIRQGSGSLIWPVNGPVVSGFGMRWGRLHAGVDIAVPAGTPIRAADSGRVVLLGWTGGYGNYTCIDHGSSLSTCYAHQSRYGTSMGASVSQGQVIGYVGCTGHCFGDHLHFETRVNGSPVDPMGYL
jgi:murein DD-endopeptidase MepM/ murein hydrolase activator NlpD